MTRVPQRPEGVRRGATEHSHDLTSTLLSTVATRSGEIANAIAATTAAQVPAWAVGQAG